MWLDHDEGLINLEHVVRIYFADAKDCDGRNVGTNLTCLTTDGEVTQLGFYVTMEQASDDLDRIKRAIKARPKIVEFFEDSQK